MAEQAEVLKMEQYRGNTKLKILWCCGLTQQAANITQLLAHSPQVGRGRELER